MSAWLEQAEMKVERRVHGTKGQCRPEINREARNEQPKLTTREKKDMNQITTITKGRARQSHQHLKSLLVGGKGIAAHASEPSLRYSFLCAGIHSLGSFFGLPSCVVLACIEPFRPSASWMQCKKRRRAVMSFLRAMGVRHCRGRGRDPSLHKEYSNNGPMQVRSNKKLAKVRSESSLISAISHIGTVRACASFLVKWTALAFHSLPTLLYMTSMTTAAVLIADY